MRSVFLLVAVVGCGLLFPSLGFCRDIFVDNVLGDDRNNGGSPVTEGAGSGPFRSLTRALVAAKKSDRVILAPGEPYYECVTLQGGRHSGFEGYPFQIIGNGAVLDGTRPLAEQDWEAVRGNLFRIRPERLSHQVLFLENNPAMRIRGEAPQNLQPMQWMHDDGWIYFRTEENYLPYQYAPRAAFRQAGLTLYDVSHVRISGLRLRGYHLDGLNAHDNARGVILEEVTAEHNGRSGFSIGGSSRMQMFQCAANHNGQAQLRMEQFCHVELFDGDFDSRSAPQLDRIGGTLKINP